MLLSSPYSMCVRRGRYFIKKKKKTLLVSSVKEKPRIGFFPKETEKFLCSPKTMS